MAATTTGGRSLALILMLAILPSRPAAAEETCAAVRFGAGKSATILRGKAPPEETLCYSLTTGAGQRATIELRSEGNVTFGIDEFIDSQTRYSFTTQARTYRIRLGQMLRAAVPQAFSLSIAVRGSPSQTAPTGAAQGGWTIDESRGSNRPRRADFAKREAGLTFDGGCNTSLPQGLFLTVTGYRGNALRRIDGLPQTVSFTTGGGAGERVHQGRMHYFGDELETTEPLPVGFVDAMAEAEHVIIAGASGAVIASLDLAGFSRFREAMRRSCGM